MANSKQVVLSSDDPLVKIALRNQFYAKAYRKALVVFILSMFVMFILTGVLIYIFLNPPKPVYFATGIDGKLTPLYPLSEPNQSDESIIQWAQKAAVASYTYSYVNYRQEIQAGSDFFTGNGWNEFMNALSSTNNLTAVKSKKMIVSAMATKPPVILKKGMIAGRFAWMLQVPLLVTYQNNTVYTQNNYIMRLVITRAPILNSPAGVGIYNIAVGPA